LFKPYQVHQFAGDVSMEGLGEYEFDISCEASLQQLFSEHRPVVIQKVIEEEIMHVSLKL
jgi:hypothetical protein